MEGQKVKPSRDMALEGTAPELLPLVYHELRFLADRWFRQQRPDHTLQPTALVHEAYLKLADRRVLTWRGRAHFFAAATRAMRQVLVDHLRYRRASKRGGAWKRITLTGLPDRACSASVDLLALDEALSALGALNERQCRIAEFRLLGGLTIEEIAALLGVCEKTVRTDWRMARAWLSERLEV